MMPGAARGDRGPGLRFSPRHASCRRGGSLGRRLGPGQPGAQPARDDTPGCSLGGRPYPGIAGVQCRRAVLALDLAPKLRIRPRTGGRRAPRRSWPPRALSTVARSRPYPHGRRASVRPQPPSRRSTGRRKLSRPCASFLQLANPTCRSHSRRRRLRRRYRAALIDEFQDTDLIQYRIFHRLFRRGPLILIGDPKQAIYRFRGAGVFAYPSARGDAGRVYTLGRS